MTAIQLTMDDVTRDPEGVRAWLEVHNLRAECVSASPGPIIRDGRITAVLFERDEHGRVRAERDPDTGDVGAVTGTITLPLRVPVPSHLGTVIE